MSIWLALGDLTIDTQDLAGLLTELNLLPLFLRRLFERRACSPLQPTAEQQVDFQRTFLAARNIRSQDDLQTWLQQQAISEQQMSRMLYEALQLQMFQQATFGPRVEPLFLERKAGLDRVTYSLLRVRERAKALELHLRLEEEEATFADLASTYSQGAEQQLNGLIGPMELGRINPVLAERLRISTPGQLWPPFEAEGWWVILRHERHLPAQLDAAMTQRLIGEMYEQWMLEQVAAALRAVQPESAPADNLATPVPSTTAPAGDAPAPSTELPAADALQPSPAADAPAESRRGLFKSIFGLG